MIAKDMTQVFIITQAHEVKYYKYCILESIPHQGDVEHKMHAATKDIDFIISIHLIK